MTTNVGALVKEASDQMSTSFDLLKSSTFKYPSGVGGKDITSITNTPDFEDGSWKESKGYEFEVVRVNERGKIVIGQADGFKTFRLQINPQELTQDEIFAIQVTPTFRGVLVEHQGTTLKDITISGTTGKSPKANGAIKESDGSPVISSGQSGYQEFHELRSYFRAYVEAKRVDTEGTLRMVFRNLKDSEFLYVEPQKFTMKRSARKATLYDYSIQLKGIGVADKPVLLGGYFPLLGGVADKAQSALDKIEYGRQVISEGIQTVRRVERDINNTVLNPLRTVAGFLEDVIRGRDLIESLGDMTRAFTQRVKDELERIEANFNDLIGKQNDNYDTAVGRTVTTQTPPAGRQPTFQELNILNGIQNVKRGLNILLAERKFFEQDINLEIDNISASYTTRNGTITDEGVVFGDISNPNFSISKPNSIRTVTISGDDTIQTIAARELGNPDRFKELVILNNLKPPYISDTGGANVLSSGSTIKIPQNAPQGQGNGVIENLIYNVTALLSQLERSLGVDVRINNDNDLAISNTGDLDLIAGTDNMAQAILIRLGLDNGSLKRHAEIGAGLKIGVKTIPSELERVRERITSSLTIDGRVESIPFLRLRQESGTTFLDMVVKLKNFNQPVPIPLVL